MIVRETVLDVLLGRLESLIKRVLRINVDKAPQKVETALILDVPDESERVVSWIREFRRRHGRDPQIPEVQQVFDLPKTTTWRRIKSA